MRIVTFVSEDAPAATRCLAKIIDTRGHYLPIGWHAADEETARARALQHWTAALEKARQRLTYRGPGKPPRPEPAPHVVELAAATARGATSSAEDDSAWVVNGVTGQPYETEAVAPNVEIEDLL